MNVRHLVVAASLLLPVCAYAVPGAPTSSDTHHGSAGEASSFSISNATQIPGKVLPAGTYTIEVVDHLSDRMIVRLEGASLKSTSFLALPKSQLGSGAHGPILVKSSAGGKVAMRGFGFPNGTVAEFVFPKSEAVSLAKANQSTFPAIDPESEGRVAAANLSSEDLQLVTLWMLTPTPVGPDAPGPGIQAVRYQQAGSAPAVRPSRHLMAALPHTASGLPLLWLTGGGLLTAGALLSGRRRMQQKS